MSSPMEAYQHKYCQGEVLDKKLQCGLQCLNTDMPDNDIKYG